MLKKTRLILSSALFLSSSFTVQGQSPEEASTAPAVEVPKPEMVDVPESELIELVGYLTALGGGIATLDLDETSIETLASGFEKGLSGEINIAEFPNEILDAAFQQAQARATAIQESADEVPEITKDALEKIGAVIVAQSGLQQLGLSSEDAPLVAKGFALGATVTEPDPEMEAKMPAFQEFIQARMAVAQEKMAAEQALVAEANKAKSVAFFDELETDESVTRSESGLYYKVIEAGSEEKPTLADTVLVHYKGTLIDGTQFDSSYDRGEPASFPLNGVVAGFGEGLTKIGPGGKIILYIPSELGYGDNPRPGGVIKPGDTLVFECELISVTPAE